MRRRWFPLLAPFLAMLPAVADEIDFNRDIRPILTSHCTACHGGVKEAGGISFVFRDKALAAGKSGNRTLIPGDPDASELIKRVTSTDPDIIMPQPGHGPRLPDTEIAKLRQWIKEGAKWQEHWAFVKPVATTPPPVRQANWPKNPIDQFVLARLEAEKLQPNPEAEPALLLRRLSIDLIGLPPILTEINAFEAAWKSNPESAWQHEIDRLLASPHYGERWASNWLDLARYADTEGLGHDQPRTAWPFRDWVVRAFNTDMPFDQFTIKQLAGDLLPTPTLDDLIATNFHRQSQNNGEGGADDEEFRVAAVMDRVATTWEAWQGVTMGCVKCHSHPYEPILHNEYYSSYAFFNNARDYDLSQHFPLIPVPKDPALAKDFTAWWNERKSLLEKNHEHQHALRAATAWQAAAALQAESKQVALEVRPGEGNPEFHTTGTASTGSVFDLRITPPANLTEITALRVEIMPADPATAIHTPEWGAVLSSIQLHVTAAGGPEARVVIARVIARVLADEVDPFYNPQLSLDHKNPAGWGPFPKIDRPRSCILLFAKPIPVGTLRLTLAHRLNAALSVPMVSKRGRVFLTNDTRWTALANDPATIASLARVTEIDAAFAKHRAAELPIIDSQAPHLQRPTHVFVRGNWLQKEPAVQQPGIPALFGKLAAEAPADRLTFANWLVSADNPLTARVAVNRLWEQLFGRGLVVTLEDFGSSGEKPSHPELLDHLALRYRDSHRWSQKAMLREIVTSATYRQSAAARPADPQNHLLARGPRVRLSAEAVRDHGLVASGLLTPTLEGPPVFPPMPPGGWTPFESQERWDTPAPGKPDRYRRSLYTYIKHTNPYPSFATFDAPTRELCTTRRILSNTPLQALDTLNSPAHIEFAEALGRRMATEIPGDLATKIATGHRITTSRPPGEKRLAELVALYQKTEDPQKAFIMIASVLLNLDEALVK